MLKCGAKITPDVSSEVSDWHKLMHGLRSTGVFKGFRLQSLPNISLCVKVVLCFSLMVESRIAAFKQNISLSVLLSQLPSSGCVCSYTHEARRPANLASSKPQRLDFICNHNLEMAAFMISFNTEIHQISITSLCLVRQPELDQTPDPGLRWRDSHDQKM